MILRRKVWLNDSSVRETVSQVRTLRARASFGSRWPASSTRAGVARACTRMSMQPSPRCAISSPPSRTGRRPLRSCEGKETGEASRGHHHVPSPSRTAPQPLLRTRLHTTPALDGRVPRPPARTRRREMPTHSNRPRPAPAWLPTNHTLPQPQPHHLNRCPSLIPWQPRTHTSHGSGRWRPSSTAIMPCQHPATTHRHHNRNPSTPHSQPLLTCLLLLPPR